jgi:hypothetical protein
VRSSGKRLAANWQFLLRMAEVLPGATQQHYAGLYKCSNAQSPNYIYYKLW